MNKNIREQFGVDYLIEPKCVSQNEIIEKIKALKSELRARFDDRKLIELYRLIDFLK